MAKTIKTFASALVAVGVLFVFALYVVHVSNFVGASTIVGNEYISTTTSSAFASATSIRQLKSGSGSLGSVVITGTSTPTAYPSMTIYDATSTMATATARVLAKFSSNALLPGTYQFDTTFNYGISIETPTGFTGVYTVTWR